MFGAEEQQGLALMRALTDAQRRHMILSPTLPGERFTAAFRDNFELAYEGLRFDQLSTAQQALLVDLLATYVGRLRSGHAEIRMEEVRRHLGETHFAWMGESGEDSAFYYRVHSPVILVSSITSAASCSTATRRHAPISTRWCVRRTATTMAGTCCASITSSSTTRAPTTSTAE